MLNGNFLTDSAESTVELGKEFAKGLKAGDIVSFIGDLGAGKTQFIKGICDYFRVDDVVSSPTFTIINHYHGENGNGDIEIYHIDLYRLNNTDQLNEIGFVDCLCEKNALKLIEWADKAEAKMPEASYTVQIISSDENENLREIFISDAVQSLN